jgi:hypothetical protein
MWPRKKTAILVIHGAGPHHAYEVTDSFVRGLYDVLTGRGREITVKHRLRQRKNWLGKGIDWVESYVSLSVPESVVTVDVYEYFWDIFMTHKQSLGGATQLLVVASKGAQQFYGRHPELAEQAMDMPYQEYFRKTRRGLKKPEFGPADYLKMLGGLGNLLSKIWLIAPLAKIVMACINAPVLGAIFNAFGGIVEDVAMQFAGDAVCYLDLDPRSTNFETRQRIMDGALEELKRLTENYEQVIVAGHSLGSVIAYDSLNRVMQETNAGRIRRENASRIIGLVTFGCPLDKIAFFFQELTPDNKEIQSQILAHLHGFKTRVLTGPDIEPEVGDPMEFGLEKVVWLNFHHPPDLVSGRLDVYDLGHPSPRHLKDGKGRKLRDGNILIKEEFHGLSVAHSCYWGADRPEKDKKTEKKTKTGTNQMYENVIDEFFS